MHSVLSQVLSEKDLHFGSPVLKALFQTLVLALAYCSMFGVFTFCVGRPCSYITQMWILVMQTINLCCLLIWMQENLLCSHISFFIELLKQIITLNNFLLSNIKGYQSRLYMWPGCLAGNPILVSIVLLYLAIFVLKQL